MDEKRFEVTYRTIESDDTTYDVSFELSEEAENALFSGVADRLAERTSAGNFDGELVHIYKLLAEQQETFPPWFEIESDRTYDLEITESMYGELSTIIGNQLGKVFRTDGAPAYRELITIWADITDQIDTQKEINDIDAEEIEAALNEAGVPEGNSGLPDPETGEFVCLIQKGDVAVYENDRGDQWYYCTICERSYSCIGEHHAEACDGDV